MISMPAFWSDPAKQTTVLHNIRSLEMGSVYQPSLMQVLGGRNFDLASLHELTGFSVSLMLVCDAVFVRLPQTNSRKFALDLFGAVTPGRDTAYISWVFIEAALTDGVAKHGEAFVEAARHAPDIFMRLSVPTYSQSQLDKFAERAKRIAKKMGQEPPTQEDPRVIALLAACGRGGEAHAGKVIGWCLDQSNDQDQALDCCSRQLLELLEAA